MFIVVLLFDLAILVGIFALGIYVFRHKSKKNRVALSLVAPILITATFIYLFSIGSPAKKEFDKLFGGLRDYNAQLICDYDTEGSSFLNAGQGGPTYEAWYSLADNSSTVDLITKMALRHGYDLQTDNEKVKDLWNDNSLFFYPNIPSRDRFDFLIAKKGEFSLRVEIYRSGSNAQALYCLTEGYQLGKPGTAKQPESSRVNVQFTIDSSK